MMQRLFVLVAVSMVVGAVAACGGGGDDGAYGCEQSFHASCRDTEIATTGNGQCGDFFGNAEPLVQACVDATATRGDALCDTAGSQGGCRFTGSGFCTVVWQFGAASPANVELACTSMGGVFIPTP